MSRATRTVVAVAGDPGGANAVLPVLLALRDAGYTVIAWPYHEAEKLWKQASLRVDGLSASVDPEERLRAVRPDMLLTGTSVNNLNLEKKFIAAALQCGVPSLSVLDFWSNYRQRFADGSGTLAFVPNQIAIMDQAAHDSMTAEGFDPATLTITGQPALDGLVESKAGSAADSRDCIRNRLGVAGDEYLITFLSQPIAEVSGGRLGYDESQVLSTVINALEHIQNRRQKPIALLIRPHPREPLAKFTVTHHSAILRVLVSDIETRNEVALASDLIIGMNTILLLETCLMGAIVVSIQPNLRAEDPLPKGYIRSVYVAGDIEPVMEQMLFDETARAAFRFQSTDVSSPAGATLRVLKLIESMLMYAPAAQ